jgi:hypothetical protein
MVRHCVRADECGKDELSITEMHNLQRLSTDPIAAMHREGQHSAWTYNCSLFAHFSQDVPSFSFFEFPRSFVSISIDHVTPFSLPT